MLLLNIDRHSGVISVVLAELVGDQEGSFRVSEIVYDFLKLDKVGFRLFFFDLSVDYVRGKCVDMVELLKYRVYITNTPKVVDTTLVEILSFKFRVLFKLKLGEFLVCEVYVVNGVGLVDFGQDLVQVRLAFLGENKVSQ
jgi:hypothetical protein